ncbi:MAG: hypothetical protein KAJ49_07220 [Arcobacteraceae bacterium]|nr:hypothetical protein [Arcobacteraceae bacterium]
MIFKLMALLAVIFLVYIVFFKRNRERDIKKKNNDVIDVLDECPTCKTFISKDEAILSNGKYYCSKECLPK